MFRINCCLGTGLMLISLTGIALAGANDSDSDWSSNQATISDQADAQSDTAPKAADADAAPAFPTDSDSPHSPGSASAMPDAAKTGTDRSADLPENIRGVVMELFPECQVIGVQFDDGFWEVRVFHEDTLWEACFSESGELVKKAKDETGGLKKDDSAEGTNSAGKHEHEAADDDNDNDNDNDNDTGDDTDDDADDDSGNDQADNDDQY